MQNEDQNEWKKRITEFASQAGFVAVGFTDSGPIEGLQAFLEKRKEAGHHTSFEENESLRRVAPRAIWSACETVVALAYPLPYTRKPQGLKGILSRSAVGEDYHRVVVDKVEKVITSMVDAGWKGEGPRFQVDTGPLNERAFAVRAGIGWIGRNQQLIIPKKGSFVSLALILLDQPIAPDEPLQSQCATCRKCIEACPAQILGISEFAANKCLSYLTQSKEVLTDIQIKQLNNRLFGCDTCQEACPHNRLWLIQEESEQSVLYRGGDPWEVLELTKGRFLEKFKPSAAGWRGKGILQRNAYFILKNLEDPKLRDWERKRREDQQLPTLIQPYLQD